jgi:putative phage-type endonuclease
MNIIDFPQGTQEWLKARAGLVTASRVADVIAKTKTGESASRANYRAQLVAERLSGQPQESFINDAMRWGTETEPLARAAYEARTGSFVDQVGLVLHPSIEWSGASPDGLAGDGLIEIKCPNTATHIDYLLNKEPPSKYRPQMAWQCACTGREWVDFISFDPRLPDKHQMLVVRYVPEKAYIQELEGEVTRFLDEVNELLVKLEAA